MQYFFVLLFFPCAMVRWAAVRVINHFIFRLIVHLSVTRIALKCLVGGAMASIQTEVLPTMTSYSWSISFCAKKLFHCCQTHSIHVGFAHRFGHRLTLILFCWNFCRLGVVDCGHVFIVMENLNCILYFINVPPHSVGTIKG